mmetsp:Transcript_17170/g.41580  ORF Transcript_17170/g.41580 Transcript_17170/m.41580 type:complete len:224 (-) Transcript_17170:2685-3356(-)
MQLPGFTEQHIPAGGGWDPCVVVSELRCAGVVNRALIPALGEGLVVPIGARPLTVVLERRVPARRVHRIQRLGIRAVHALPSHVACVRKQTPGVARRAVLADGAEAVGSVDPAALLHVDQALAVPARQRPVLPALRVLPLVAWVFEADGAVDGVGDAREGAGGVVGALGVDGEGLALHPVLIEPLVAQPRTHRQAEGVGGPAVDGLVRDGVGARAADRLVAGL